MIPLGQAVVTLYHRKETVDARGRTSLSWQRILLDGCSWRHAARYSLSNAHEVVCRIPATHMRPVIGDVLVLGDVRDEVASATTLAELLEKCREIPGAFRVMAVNDNVQPGFPLTHYAVRGE